MPPNVNRELAVFTIMQDEPEFIHPWINHYKKHVSDPRDLYVLIHSPTRPDGTPMRSEETPAWHRAQELMTDYHGVTAVPVHRALAFDHRWLAEVVARFQSFLLSSYAWVLFAEADEFILPMPVASTLVRSSLDCTQGATTLVDFVQGLGPNPPPAVRATGFEVVQQPGEPPVAPGLYCDGANVNLAAADLIGGCKFWYRSDMYSKTVLANIPLRWEVGFHTTDNVALEIARGMPAQSLALVHLHKADFDLALGRARRSRARKWSQPDIEQRWGWQNRIDDVAELRAFWGMDDAGSALESSRLGPIAPGIKEALR